VDGLKWRGELRIEVVRQGRVIARETRSNLITDKGLNFLAGALAQAHKANGGITKIAVGTSSAAPAASDTALGAEVYRANIDSVSFSGTGQIEITAHIPDYAANVQIEEIGFFTEGSGSVDLFSRILYSRLKNNTEQINLVYTGTIGRA
jgi:hypothetical protein